MNPIDQAVASFENDFLCSQSILSAFAPALGLDRLTALRIAAPFGSGMGRMGEVCGAVSGAFMVIGLKYGHTTAEDTEAKERTYQLVQQFAALFRSRHGTILCRELTGYTLSNPGEMQAARESGVFKNQCPKYIRSAGEILEELLKEI